MSEVKWLVSIECIHYGLIFSKNSEDTVINVNLKELGRWSGPLSICWSCRGARLSSQHLCGN